MSEKLDWEPSYGFCGVSTKANAKLAEALEALEALEAVRRRVCAYNMGLRNEDVRCDCKYGIDLTTKRTMGSEQTGCPELRELINRLLHRPETFND
jgi:hypothetical protein